MGRLKDKIIKLLILLSFIGCSKRYNIDEIERDFKINIKDKIEFVSIDEQWSNFNGDGEKVVIFNLNQDYLKEIYKNAEKKGFKKVDTKIDKEYFTERELKYINGKVLYKTNFKENEVNTLVIDTLNRKVIYYYGLM